jgi:hypothetical protein
MFTSVDITIPCTCTIRFYRGSSDEFTWISTTQPEVTVIIVPIVLRHRYCYNDVFISNEFVQSQIRSHARILDPTTPSGA